MFVIVSNVLVRFLGKNTFKGGDQLGGTQPGGFWNDIQNKVLQFGSRNVSDEMQAKAREARLARFEAELEAKED